MLVRIFIQSYSAFRFMFCEIFQSALSSISYIIRGRACSANAVGRGWIVGREQGGLHNAQIRARFACLNQTSYIKPNEKSLCCFLTSTDNGEIWVNLKLCFAPSNGIYVRTRWRVWFAILLKVLEYTFQWKIGMIFVRSIKHSSILLCSVLFHCYLKIGWIGDERFYRRI